MNIFLYIALFVIIVRAAVILFADCPNPLFRPRVWLGLLNVCLPCTLCGFAAIIWYGSTVPLWSYWMLPIAFLIDVLPSLKTITKGV